MTMMMAPSPASNRIITTLLLTLFIYACNNQTHGLSTSLSAQQKSAASSSSNISRRDAASSIAAAAFIGTTTATVAATSAPQSAHATAAAAATQTDLSTFIDGPRGLKYKITKEGEGSTPVRGQKVSMKYTLTVDGFKEDGGTQVDSNAGFLGMPFSVPVGVGMVVKGWDLTLIDMKKGEARKLVIPPELGYGSAGAGGKIKPNTTLYFEMEMTDMDSPPQLSDKQLEWLENNPV